MDLPIKILIIGVIKKDNSILLRKKFKGSKPYKETWYLFGCETKENSDQTATFIDYAKNNLGVNLEFIRDLPEDTETKEDHDGVKKYFIYITKEFNYISGEPILPKDHEVIEFVNFEKLKELDIVPPARKVLKEVNYF